MATKNRVSIKSRVNVATLGYGIHDNAVISKVDIAERGQGSKPDSRMIYITFTVVDPESRERKSAVELKWFRPDPSNDYTYSNIQEMFVQLAGILMCYLSEEDAFKVFDEVVEATGVKDLNEFKNNKWKKAELKTLMDNIAVEFKKAVLPFVGLDKDLIRVKITTDNKGEYSNVPKYGKFTEPMTVEKTRLAFSTFELSNHAKLNGASQDPAEVLKNMG